MIHLFRRTKNGSCNSARISSKTSFLTKFLFISASLLLAPSAWSQLVINEILQNPSAVTDSAGEWFEIYNPTGGAIDINGWTIADDGSDSHVITNGGPLLVPAGGYLVLGNNTNSGTNGGATVDYGYGGSWFLANGADEVVLIDGSATEIDRVNYDNGATFPDPNGASMSLESPGLDNNVGSNWCESTSAFGDGDLGTPGAANICIIPETAPTVASSNPINGGSGVALDADIEITFSEEVDVAGAWYDLSCTTSGANTAVVTGGPTTYTLNPDSDFVMSETCTVNIYAAGVTDVDVDDPPDNMAEDDIIVFTTIVPAVESPVVINELDADQSGTDAAEFIELFDGGTGNTSLDGMVLVLFNGSNDSSYLAADLDGFSTDADGFFVMCGELASVENCDLDIGAATNLIQNGADAAALYQNDASNFPNGTAVTSDFIIDALVYDTSDADDPVLLTLLNPGQPQVNEQGGGDGSGHSNQRCPNGIGGARNTDSYIQEVPTPGEANDCVVPVINEVDADQTGTDTAEFIELYSPGAVNFPLDGYSIVMYNGSDDASYDSAYDLDGFSTDENGYFVLCGSNANVPNCDLDVADPTSLLQNGADAVALVYGDADDYPNDTPVSVVNLVDAIVYDTSDSDDAGLLVLLNAGQPQVNENGGGAAGTESNQRCPNGFGGLRNTDTYVQATPTPGAVNMCAALEIYDIQGDGSTSIYDGFDVLTADNVVTAVGPEGFNIQTPDARADGSADTSNGIYVFTDGVPTVAVGDNVDVLGRVEEFFDFTEFTNNPMVTINSSGNPLPAAILLGNTVPSPDPTAPSCAIEYECYEGMLVQVIDGSITGGNQDFSSDLIAEAYISAGSRSYREPGVEFPGLGGSIPTWDGNPEVFELDPDRMGLPNAILRGGSTFSATGVIGFDFGGYELWPTALSVAEPTLPRAVRGRMMGEMTVGSLNVFRFATDGVYESRIGKLSLYIRDALNAPDILAVQEADNIDALQDLADQITLDDGSINYTPYLIESMGQGGIDVGYMVRDNVSVDSVVQMGADEIFTYDDSLLHDRPPLIMRARYTGNGMDFPVAVMVVHNRSLNGIETERVQLKRLTQAQSIAVMAQDFQTNNPDTPFVIVGDFNGFQFTDGYAHVVGHIQGDFDPTQELNTAPDLVNPNLTNQVLSLPAEEQYSFVFLGSGNALDHALTSAATDPWVRGFEFGRGNADAAEDLVNTPDTALRSSDHDGMVLFLMTDADGDGVADDVDDCPQDPSSSVFNPSAGCTTAIPALDNSGLLLLLLLLGGMGAYTIRYRSDFALR